MIIYIYELKFVNLELKFYQLYASKYCFITNFHSPGLAAIERFKAGQEPLEEIVDVDPRDEVLNQISPVHEGRKRRKKNTDIALPGNVSPRSSSTLESNIKLERIDETEEEEQNDTTSDRKQYTSVFRGPLGNDDGLDVSEEELILHSLPNWPEVLNDILVTKNLATNLSSHVLDFYSLLADNKEIADELIPVMEESVLSEEDFVDCFNFVFPNGLVDFMNWLDFNV